MHARHRRAECTATPVRFRGSDATLALLASKALSGPERAAWEQRRLGWEQRRAELEGALARAGARPAPEAPAAARRARAAPQGPSSLAIQHVLARPRAGQTPRSSILSYVGVTSVSVDYTPAGSAARCERCGQVLPEHSLRIGAATLSAHGGAIAGAHRKLYHRDWCDGRRVDGVAYIGVWRAQR